jgi:hypothetical protein
MLFDDTTLGDQLEGGGAFTPECDAILEELLRATANLVDDRPFDEVLESGAWREITSKARAALLEIERLSATNDNCGT